jgi:hypothetical protein
VIFHNLPRAGRPPIPPSDITFPLADLDRWKSGGPVNRLVVEEEEEAP